MPEMSALPHVVRKVPSRSRNELIDVTAEVAAAVTSMHLTDGVVTIFVPHTTAGVTINENADPDVKHDLLKKLAALVPHHEAYYRHVEGNSDSHLKTACVGNSAQVIVEGGTLLLGRWQGIYFCEFDGPREREMWIKGIGV
jgi:secondary thiamine-phosphate synthase enzyme